MQQTAPPHTRARRDTAAQRSGARLGRPAVISLCVAPMWLALSVVSKGFRWEDEYAHLLFSKWMWHDPRLLVDIWGRPLHVLVYAPAALLGTWAARVVTVALACLAAYWTGKAAEARGMDGRLATAFVIAQPVFFGFAFGALPGTLMAAFFALLLFQDARGNVRGAAIAAALMPLARTEGVIVAVVYAGALLVRGRARDAWLPFAGLAAWNVAGWAVTGSPLFLLTRNPYPLIGSIYPRGGFLYLERILPAGAGVAIALLALVGFLASARKPNFTHVVAALSAIFFTLLWGVPMFASTPTPVYLIGFAPLIAMFAATGARALPSFKATAIALAVLGAFLFVPRRLLAIHALTSPVSGLERIALTAAFVALIAALIVARGRWAVPAILVAVAIQVVPMLKPVPASAHERVAARAAAWVRANLGGRAVSAVSPDFMWDARVDPFTRWRPGSLVQANAVATGTGVVVWDSQFSAHEGRTSLASLETAGWHETKRFAEGDTTFVVLTR